jgi:histidyl-tRNA synthetase
MFRYERPQKGRYRQFDQIGAECFGMPGPDVDAELLLMNARIWRKLGLDGDIRLELNSLGNPDARVKFKEKLADYLQAYEQDLDEDSQRRLTTNPLRILDSKSSKTQEILRGAPVLADFMDNESKQHFEGLQGLLDDNGIAYEVNPNIVRGLDYYNKTVFEWITTTLGSQGTVCGGGRYDGLVEQLGGKPSPGVGFAMGLDRLSLMLAEKMESSKDADVYVVSKGNAARATALRLAESIRDQLSGKKVVVHCGDGKFKSQMKKADASGADLALVLGEDEVAAGTVSIKSLREGGEQSTISQETLAQYCLDYFSKEN